MLQQILLQLSAAAVQTPIRRRDVTGLWLSGRPTQPPTTGSKAEIDGQTHSTIWKKQGK
jgi:hypothetical protein